MSKTVTKSLTGDATAYCLKGTTSTGSQTGPGTIAVDPKKIPYHKKLHVAWEGGSYDGESLDTGKACKDGKIVCDLWFSTSQACKNFGRKQVTVTWEEKV